jgi:hypothetical protein
MRQHRRYRLWSNTGTLDLGDVLGQAIANQAAARIFGSGLSTKKQGGSEHETS